MSRVASEPRPNPAAFARFTGVIPLDADEQPSIPEDLAIAVMDATQAFGEAYMAVSDAAKPVSPGLARALNRIAFRAVSVQQLIAESDQLATCKRTSR